MRGPTERGSLDRRAEKAACVSKSREEWAGGETTLKTVEKRSGFRKPETEDFLRNHNAVWLDNPVCSVAGKVL